LSATNTLGKLCADAQCRSARARNDPHQRKSVAQQMERGQQPADQQGHLHIDAPLCFRVFYRDSHHQRQAAQRGATCSGGRCESDEPDIGEIAKRTGSCIAQ
jgi:hypothetical protein